jgi:hypothetical protein
MIKKMDKSGQQPLDKGGQPHVDGDGGKSRENKFKRGIIKQLRDRIKITFTSS